MASINSVVLVGRLTKDPELQATSSGKRVSRFTLAVDKMGKDAGANFFSCVCWEQRAEFLTKYSQKGTQIAIKGRLDKYEYEKDGVKHSFTSVIADEIQLLSRVEAQKEDSTPKTELESEEIPLDDIPF